MYFCSAGAKIPSQHRFMLRFISFRYFKPLCISIGTAQLSPAAALSSRPYRRYLKVNVFFLKNIYSSQLRFIQKSLYFFAVLRHSACVPARFSFHQPAQHFHAHIKLAGCFICPSYCTLLNI